MEKHKDFEEQVIRELSRSRERPSSKWRQGVTHDNLTEQEEESVREALIKQKKGMVYPTWWEGTEAIKQD